jgi:hypothetical protein
LVPPPLWRREVARYRDPDLAQVLELARIFDVSKEAAARAYATYHDHLVAIVVAHHRKVDKIYRDITKFPRLCVRPGDPIPSSSILCRASTQATGPTELSEARPEDWLQSDWGKRMPELTEQVLPQQDGFALVLLWVEIEEDQEENDDERTSKERYRDQQAKWNR